MYIKTKNSDNKSSWSFLTYNAVTQAQSARIVTEQRLKTAVVEVYLRTKGSYKRKILDALIFNSVALVNSVGVVTEKRQMTGY